MCGLETTGGHTHTHTYTHARTHTHTHTHTHRRFSSFAAVRISKGVSGVEIEVFIITLYAGKSRAFKVAH